MIYVSIVYTDGGMLDALKVAIKEMEMLSLTPIRISTWWDTPANAHHIEFSCEQNINKESVQ
jgi:hypothetical protein